MRSSYRQSEGGATNSTAPFSDMQPIRVNNYEYTVGRQLRMMDRKRSRAREKTLVESDG